MKKQISTSIFLFILLLFTNDLLFSQQNGETPLKTGDSAPTFFTRDLDGNEFFLTDYAGKRRTVMQREKRYIVVLSFFASWCKPCLKEIPELEKLAEKNQDLYKDHVRFFLMNHREKQDKIHTFLNKYPFSFPVLLDSYGKNAEKYGITQLPSLVIINKEGKIVLFHVGYKETLVQEIEKILDKNIKNTL